MQKQVKQKTPQQVLKEKMLFVFMINFSFGFVIFIMFDMLSKFVSEQVWIKIIPSVIGNIPIGIIELLTVTIAFGFLIYLFFGVDYKIYMKGFDSIHIEGENKSE